MVSLQALVAAGVCFGQANDAETWARTTSNGPAGAPDSNKLMTIDPVTGDVYFAGQEELQGDQKAIGVWKYDACGTMGWHDSWYRVVVNGNFYPTAVAFGTISTTGTKLLAVTGAGTTDAIGLDMVTILYDVTAPGPPVLVWSGDGAKIFSEPFSTVNAIPVDVAIDLGGSVYVVGNSIGSATNADIIVIQYPRDDQSPGWTRRFVAFEETGLEQAYDMFLVDQPVNPESGLPDAFDGVYIVGSVKNGFGTQDMLLLSYTLGGDLRIKAAWDGGLEDYAYCVFVEDIRDQLPHDPPLPPDPVVVVTGTSQAGTPTQQRWRYATVVYNIFENPNGTIGWTPRYGASNPARFYDNNGTQGKHIPRDMAVAWAGGIDEWRIYITGESWGGTEFDCATVFYQPGSGNQVAVQRFDPPIGGEDRGMALVTDPGGWVYVAGTTANGTNLDYFTIKYRGTGTIGWNNVPQGAIRFPMTNNIGNDQAHSIRVFAPFCQQPIDTCNQSGQTCLCEAGDRPCIFTLGRTATLSGVRHGLVKYHQYLP